MVKNICQLQKYQIINILTNIIHVNASLTLKKYKTSYKK